MNENERLKELYPWLTAVARRINPRYADDLKQIGAIAAWKALGSFDGKSESPEPWMKMHAVNKMKTWIARTTGTDASRTKPGEDIPVEDEDLDSFCLDRYDYLSYHKREIAQAVSSLPKKQAEYVILRFWYQRTHGELEKYFGYNPTGLWYKTARPTLRKALAHLEDTVWS